MSCESATASGGGAAGPDWRGVASALIYQPGNHAKTDELIALAQVAAKYKGIYISHIRNEGDHEMEAIDELITIARKAGVPSEIYHLKVAGEKNWKNLPEVIQKVGITEGSLWRSNHEAEEQPRKLWPFCGQSSHQLPLMATIYCISETTLRVSQRKRYDLFSFGYTAAALAAGSRFSDSQSSNQVWIPGKRHQFCFHYLRHLLTQVVDVTVASLVATYYYRCGHRSMSVTGYFFSIDSCSSFIPLLNASGVIAFL